jgi:hypothetical protein
MADFGKNKRTVSGRQDYCKDCHSGIQGLFGAKHPVPAEPPTEIPQLVNTVRGVKAKSHSAGNLYIIGNLELGTYKIGVSVNVKKRLKTLQTGSPVPLTLVASKPVDDMYSTEEKTHIKLAAYRLHGEWFKLTYEQALAAIAPI